MDILAKAILGNKTTNSESSVKDDDIMTNLSSENNFKLIRHQARRLVTRRNGNGVIDEQDDSDPFSGSIIEPLKDRLIRECTILACSSNSSTGLQLSRAFTLKNMVRLIQHLSDPDQDIRKISGFL